MAKENPRKMKVPQVKISGEEKVTEEAVEITLRRALRFYSTIQAEDGHWPGDYGGPLFLLPGLVKNSRFTLLFFFLFFVNIF